MGKTAGRQPVGLVESANKTLLKEVSGYCIMVSSTQTQKCTDQVYWPSQTNVSGPFKHILPHM